MDRFAIFIIFVAWVSAVFLILGFTLTSTPRLPLFLLSIVLAAVAILGLIFFCVRRKPGSRDKSFPFNCTILRVEYTYVHIHIVIKALISLPFRGGFDDV